MSAMRANQTSFLAWLTSLRIEPRSGEMTSRAPFHHALEALRTHIGAHTSCSLSPSVPVLTNCGP